jgi:hypothetical protein
MVIPVAVAVWMEGRMGGEDQPLSICVTRLPELPDHTSGVGGEGTVVELEAMAQL